MSRCGRTTKLSNFSQSGAVFDGSRFVLADDTTVTGAQVKAFLRAVTKTPSTVNVVDPIYNVTGEEDFILCTGDVTINLLESANTDRDINISARGGTVTIVPAGSDTVQQATITDGNSLLIIADNSGYWRAV